MKAIKLILALLVLSSLAACGGSPTANSAPGVSPVPQPTASATSPEPVITVVQQVTVTGQPTLDGTQSRLEEVIKNSTFTTPNYNKIVTLQDGKFEAGSGADYLLVQLLPQMAFGKVIQDGKPEAAILMGENGGGSGVFVSLIALTFNNDNPTQAGSALVDDRPKIRALSIDKDGQIILDALIHGPADAMVNPTLPVVETYQVDSGSLVLTRLTSKTPDGLDRSITINTPAGGAAVSGAIKIQGSISIAPAGNNLTYSINDAKGSQLAQGFFPLNGANAGDKATFETTLQAPSLPSGTAFRLLISAVDAQDDSRLALDSVKLVVK